MKTFWRYEYESEGKKMSKLLRNMIGGRPTSVDYFKLLPKGPSLIFSSKNSKYATEKRRYLEII